ncbi:MAG: DUF4277 domain-containing protein [Neobacillus sp.]
MNFVSKNVDHLGIVAGVCHEIGLAEEIDKLVQGFPHLNSSYKFI